jgi:hypothetical protein
MLGKLDRKQDNSESLARRIVKNPNQLSVVFNGISSENPRIKFRSAKVLKIISEKNPKLLYPKIDFFIELLGSENNIIKWNAMDTTANLATVDSKNKFDKIFKKFYGFLYEGSLVTASHVVDNSGKIAGAKPNLQSKITNELLKIEKVPLPTEECKNILLGKTIVAFDMYFDKIQNKKEVISFVKRQLTNSRNATKVKAEKFLSKNS